jgi:hypothetical protein
MASAKLVLRSNLEHTDSNLNGIKLMAGSRLRSERTSPQRGFVFKDQKHEIPSVSRSKMATIREWRCQWLHVERQRQSRIAAYRKCVDGGHSGTPAIR